MFYNYEQKLLFRACVIIMCVSCFTVVLTDLLRNNSTNMTMAAMGIFLLFVAVDLDK